jgi:hypothetical protein
MAFTYNYTTANYVLDANKTADGLDVDATARNAFWSLMAQYNAAYFCGHEHITAVAQQPDPTSTYTANNPWQVIVGSGGSPFDVARLCAGVSGGGAATSCPVAPTTTSPYDRYYAWAVVNVRSSGGVDLELYGFSDAYGQTKKLRTIASFQ